MRAPARDELALLPHAQRAVATTQEVQREALAWYNEVRKRLVIGTILDPALLRLSSV